MGRFNGLKKFKITNIFSGIKGKMLIVFTFLILVIFSGFLITKQLIHDKKNDAVLINVAARQGVMANGYVKDFFLFLKTGEMSGVQATLKSFDDILEKLEKGGEVTVDGKKVTLKKEMNTDITDQLIMVKKEWGALKELAVEMIGEDPDDKSYAGLSNKSQELGKEVSTLLGIYQHQSDKKFDLLELIQIIILFSTFIVCIMAFLYIQIKIMKPMGVSISKMETVAAELLKQAGDVGNISDSLSDSSTQQASALQETTATMHEIQSMVKLNSSSAQATAEKSESSKVLALEGRSLVSHMVDSITKIDSSIGNIKSQMEVSNEEILSISNIINEIDEKTKVINDIVFQTKLLSFNASVEAARAGENGKGFAVVAEEVGNLASMSGKAAEEIVKVLESSEKQIKLIVSQNSAKLNDIVDNASREVAQGKKNASECDDTLKGISTQTEEINGLIGSLAESSTEQFEGIKNTYDALSQLDDLSNTNSQLSQESSANATLLNQKAETLENDLNLLKKLLIG